MSRAETTSCVLCEERAENTQEISFHVFPGDKDRRKKWLDAIGKTDTEVLACSSLCSRHFPQSCFIGSILMDDAVPTLELRSNDSTSTAEFAKNRSVPQESGMRLCSDACLTPTVARPIIRRRRIHMLSDEEMKEMPPIKYVRHLKSVNWDEISKIPTEAKIVWEVAMEELKEGNDKIKQLQAHVRHLKATVRKLKSALKARTKVAAAAAAAAAAARRCQSLN